MPTNRNKASASYRLLTAAIVLGAGVIPAGNASAGSDRPVLIVRSSDLPQYDEVVASFERTIGVPDTQIAEIKISASRERGTQGLTDAAATHAPRAVFALGARAAYLSRRVLPDIPTVFAMVVGWQRYRLDQGPVTGVALEIPADALFTRVKLMLPHIDTLGVIYSDNTEPHLLAQARKAASMLGMSLVEERVRAADEVAGAYRRTRREIDALWMVADPVVVTRDNFAFLARRTRTDGVAFIGFSENFVRAGAMLSVSPSYSTMGTQAAIQLDRLLADPSTPPPVQPPVAASLVVNADTVASLGLDLDATTVDMADMVISTVDVASMTDTAGAAEEQTDVR